MIKLKRKRILYQLQDKRIKENKTLKYAIIIQTGRQQRNVHLQSKRFQAKTPSEQVQQASVVNKQEFNTMRESQQNFMKKTQSSYLGRENLFVTKPLVRLDKDFKDQPSIRNVLSISDDTPNWCQGVSKFYTIEHFDSSKKARIKPVTKTDIFGNKIQKYENNFLFKCMEPSGSVRFEQKKMIIADKSSMDEMKKITTEDIKRGKCKIQWTEDIDKQKFDNPRPLRRIGFTPDPYIKKLERKRNPNKLALSKIGESEVYSKIDKEKVVQLKIGHGSAQTLNPLKY